MKTVVLSFGECYGDCKKCEACEVDNRVLLQTWRVQSKMLTVWIPQFFLVGSQPCCSRVPFYYLIYLIF